jgi:PAT family beta-lactamase induction signal transducer AmpG
LNIYICSELVNKEYKNMIKSNNTFYNIFTKREFFEIFILGILSGMPFSILYTVLLLIIKESGISLSTATVIAFCLVPYNLKFVWAPLVDRLSIPILNRFGHRKSWMLLATISNAIMIYYINPTIASGNFSLILLLGTVFCFSASTYDIAYDAWRIERVQEEYIALSSAVAVFGYRLGMMIISVGVLYLADLIQDWSLTMLYTAMFFLVFGILLTTTKESSAHTEFRQFSFANNIINPFKDFFQRNSAIYILFFMILYKAGEAMIAFTATPFYLDLGFSKTEIASVTKLFGFAATTFGTIAGGIICIRIGYLRALMICGVIQMLSNSVFIWMHHQGYDITSLFVTIFVDNFSGGLGTASLIGYLGYLCNKQYTATQYALFSSATTLVNHTLVAYSGTIVTHLGWDMFFLFSICFGLPSLFLLSKIYKNENSA